MSLLLAAESEGGGLEFPSLKQLVEWPDIIDSIGFNKIALIHVLSVVLPTALNSSSR